MHGLHEGRSVGLLKMTALLMNWCGVAFMDGGSYASKVTSGGSQEEELKKKEGLARSKAELIVESARFCELRAQREVFFFCWLLVFTSAAISD